jgi:hypothetical protein
MNPYEHKSVQVSRHVRLVLTPEMEREIRRHRWHLRWEWLKGRLKSLAFWR